MKRHLTTGLILLLPTLVTLFIVILLINFLTHPFLYQVELFIKKLGVFGENETVLALASKAMILCLLFAFISLIGLIGRLYLFKSLQAMGFHMINQIPYINKIYGTSHEIVHSLFSSSSVSLTHAVYVPFLQKENLVIGFVTCEKVTVEFLDNSRSDFVSVFVPGTPNPTGGCLMLYKPEKLHHAQMEVKDAMRWVVSCGTT